MLSTDNDLHLKVLTCWLDLFVWWLFELIILVECFPWLHIYILKSHESFNLPRCWLLIIGLHWDWLMYRVTLANAFSHNFESKFSWAFLMLISRWLSKCCCWKYISSLTEKGKNSLRVLVAFDNSSHKVMSWLIKNLAERWATSGSFHVSMTRFPLSLESRKEKLSEKINKRRSKQSYKINSLSIWFSFFRTSSTTEFLDFSPFSSHFLHVSSSAATHWLNYNKGNTWDRKE